MKLLLTLILIGINAQATSFKKDVVPVMKKHCFACHNEQWPDKNWKKYDTAKQFADKILKRVVIDKNMPPGNLSDMKDKERDIIKSWVEDGAKP